MATELKKPRYTGDCFEEIRKAVEELRDKMINAYSGSIYEMARLEEEAPCGVGQKVVLVAEAFRRKEMRRYLLVRVVDIRRSEMLRDWAMFGEVLAATRWIDVEMLVGHLIQFHSRGGYWMNEGFCLAPEIEESHVVGWKTIEDRKGKRFELARKQLLAVWAKRMSSKEAGKNKQNKQKQKDESNQNK